MRLRTLIHHDFPDRDVIFTARATTAIYLALRSILLKMGPGEVVVPSTVCPSVPLAVHYAGFTVRFCDVEENTFCMSERTLGNCLGPETRAIIIVHLFGKAADSKRIVEIAHEKEIAVIEDVAQGIGGRTNGRLLGDFGDYAALCFSEKKILTGGEGGALLLRDASEKDAILEEEALLPDGLGARDFIALARDFNESMRDFFTRMRRCRLNQISVIPMDIRERYRPLFVFRMPKILNLEAVAASYEQLPSERIRRYNNYQVYTSYLKSETAYIRFNSEEMCWRLPVLTRQHESQLALITKIRAGGGLISDHYFPTSCLWGDRSCPTAEKIGMNAVNLWVDSKFDRERLPWICEAVDSMSAKADC